VITVNGEIVQLDAVPLSELLTQMNLGNRLCAVEVNKELIPHKERETYVLQDGDSVEIVTIVGGG